jgi:hypothetical protein
MIVPLDLRVPILGRLRASFGVRVGSSPFTDDADEPGVADVDIGSRLSESEGAAAEAVVLAAGVEAAVEGGSVDEGTVAVEADVEAVAAVGSDDVIFEV